jgi:dihydroorotase
MNNREALTIIRPDDWHLHLRDGEMMKAVLPYSSNVYGRAIIMPNINPPVRTTQDAREYRDRITSLLPPGHSFQPLMACYLTDQTSPDDVIQGYQENVFTVLKLYPSGATTNSEFGVTSLKKIYRVLEAAQENNVPLSIHGESGDPALDFFDREEVFIETELDPLRKDFPELKIILEHVTTKQGIDYVRSATSNLAGTITPHHLYLTRNDIFLGGLTPHMFCLPIAQREEDCLAIRTAATSGDEHFFLGTDSAPHLVSAKESGHGVPGIFNAPGSIERVAQIFDDYNAMQNLEAFVSLNGAKFYGFAPNTETIRLRKKTSPPDFPRKIVENDVEVFVFTPKEQTYWCIESESQK